MTALDELFEFNALFDGRDVAGVLALARYGDIGPFTRDPVELDTEARRSVLQLALMREVAMFDGQRLRSATADRIIDQPMAHAAILDKRNAFMRRGRESGRIYATCPHCQVGEVTLTLLSYASRFGAVAPGPVAADPSFLLPPALADAHPPGRRASDAACAWKLRFDLPSAKIGMGSQLPGSGVLGDIEPEREARAWSRWAPGPDSGKKADLGRTWWRRGNPCFRAAVALSASIALFDSPVRPTPELLVRMPAIDVYFLDAMYYLTHFVDVARGAVADTCPVCSGRYFPVASKSPRN